MTSVPPAPWVKLSTCCKPGEFPGLTTPSLTTAPRTTPLPVRLSPGASATGLLTGSPGVRWRSRAGAGTDGVGGRVACGDQPPEAKGSSTGDAGCEAVGGRACLTDQSCAANRASEAGTGSARAAAAWEAPGWAAAGAGVGASAALAAAARGSRLPGND